MLGGDHLFLDYLSDEFLEVLLAKETDNVSRNFHAIGAVHVNGI